MRKGEHVFYAVLAGPNGKLGNAASVTLIYNEIAPLMPEHYARWNFKASAHKAAIKRFVSYAYSRPARMLQFIKYCDLLPLSQSQMEHYFGDIMQIMGVSYDQIKKP